jgi:HD superfamily phosphohydrolase
LDDVNGPIHLNRLERDAIDTPEFQRLFRLGQLGFVDLVYPTANHTRGAHSIGACFWSKRVIDMLNESADKLNRAGISSWPKISHAERVLMSLGGLLHDIPHGPFSHDIEKKTHYIYRQDSEKPDKIKSHYGPYEKHDNFLANPALYVFLMEPDESILARVLRRYSPLFAELLLSESEQNKLEHLNEFCSLVRKSWPGYEQELLPSLLFHLLVYEKPEEASDCPLNLRTSFRNEKSADWGLGPNKLWGKLHEAWYQPFRHDVIGDTLSADLIDYLMRDQSRLGMKNQLDLKLLSFYTLVPHAVRFKKDVEKKRYRCALDLTDHKRGTFRAERLNDIFRLLDLRHQIHEKAVYHRVVQSAIAMLSRAILILGDKKPSLTELYGMQGSTPALACDDLFLERLIHLGEEVSQLNGTQTIRAAHQNLALKIAERRVYRPLVVIPGDRVPILLDGICDFKLGLEHPLRELAAIADSAYYSSFFLLISSVIEGFLQHALESENDVDTLLTEIYKDRDRLKRVSSVIPKRVIFWTTPYKQLYKDPSLLVRVDRDVITTIDKLKSVLSISDTLRSRVKAGILDAETKNEALWKFYVFLSDGLFYTGTLSKLLPDHPCARSDQNHGKHLQAAQDLVVRALRLAWQYWQIKEKKVDLGRQASLADLAELLELFVSDGSWFRVSEHRFSKKVSAVKVGQYLHGDQSYNCRDVRYKFDSGRDLDTVLRETIADEEKRKLVQQAIRATGFDVAEIRGEEMAELVSRLAQAENVLPDLISIAGRNSPVRGRTLKSIWLRDLS